MKVALACGGTGGHIFPGLATGDALIARGHDVTLWLAGKDVESTAVQGWPGRIITVKAKGFPTAASLRVIGAAWSAASAIKTCHALMKQESPDIVLAMGSYASVGPVVAAACQRIPYVLHESNAVPGRAISWLSRGAAAVAISFDETRAHLRRLNLVLTGMPLRKELTAAARNRPSVHPSTRPFHLLLMGGSRGAHAINELGARALVQAHIKGAHFRVTHLAGVRDADSVRDCYQQAGVDHVVHPFAHQMETVYADCDFAICRAGAATCTELLAFGVPSLLIPYPSAVRDHQTANARAMVRMAAAQLIDERDLTESWLAGYVADLSAQRGNLDKMKSAALSHATLGAADALADLVIQIAGSRHVA